VPLDEDFQLTRTTRPHLRGALASLLFIIVFTAAQAQQSAPPSQVPIEQLIKVDVPVVLCIDDKPTAGGQPTRGAYAKAAGHGYRSILTLRSGKDGIDRGRERAMVERENLRYFNISIVAANPQPAQVDAFLKLVRDKSNHPMLINCAAAERVAPLMTMFRIVEQGWSEEKALDEAARTGVNRDRLRKFAQDYLAQRKSKRN
jgi:protein tyrosine phosphatase (PTP) superfamily phosphohydrolase (DUF442 family)